MHYRSSFMLLAVLLQSCRTQSCTDYDLRLVGGQVPNEGRVEICVDQQWGTVCDDSWGDADATVVCRQLGYPPENATSAQYGQGSGEIFLGTVECSGSESRLIDCNHPPVGVENCSHHEDAGVYCAGCQNGDIRITGGTADETNIGRVEICFDKTWGTVCNDDWNSNAAIVACRQLGYSTRGSVALTTPGASGYSQGTGPIFLDNTVCDGTETRLIDCDYDNHTADCSHSEDAGVQCESLCQTGSVRLVGGLTEQEGRVEVCINEMWGTVCDDDWDAADASIVCMQLGFSPTNATAYMGARFGEGFLPILMDNVACQGPETRLIDCAYDEHTIDCFHSEDAGVHCHPLCQNGDIRLVGGGPQRVEVCVDGGWSTACADDSRDEIDVNEVCRQLGFPCHGTTDACTPAPTGISCPTAPTVMPIGSVSTLTAVFMGISGFLLVLLVVVLVVSCWKLHQQKYAPNNIVLRNPEAGVYNEIRRELPNLDPGVYI